MATVALLQAPRSDYLELARTRSGRVFRKQILKRGKFAHPTKKGEFIEVNDELLQALAKNFEDGVCDIVQIPLVGDNNLHSEAPDRNLGEVIGLEVTPQGLDAIMDIRSVAHEPAVGKTILGASAMFALDYENTDTGEMVGPTLLHVAATNRPHVTGLEPFRELVAASSDQSLDEVVEYTAEAEEDPQMLTLEEMKAALKADHNIDLDALLAEKSSDQGPSESEQVLTQLSALLTSSGVVKLSAKADETPDPQEILGAVQKIHDANVALSSSVDTLLDDKAVAEVDKLVGEGRILPVQRDAMLKLSRTDHEMFAAIVPATPIVKLSHEGGTTEVVDMGGYDPSKTEETINRYVELVSSGKK